MEHFYYDLVCDGGFSYDHVCVSGFYCDVFLIFDDLDDRALKFSYFCFRAVSELLILQPHHHLHLHRQLLIPNLFPIHFPRLQDLLDLLHQDLQFHLPILLNLHLRDPLNRHLLPLLELKF